MYVVYEKVNKLATDLVVGDVIDIGGVHAKIETMITWFHDVELKLTTSLAPKWTDKRIKLTIPKTTTITVLK